MNYSEDISDKELVILVQQNPDAFSVIVDRYWNRLFAFVRRTSYFAQEDIEDILQEVFIKIYKNINDYDDSFEFSTWIYRITRNHVIDEIRKKGARPQQSQADIEDLSDRLMSDMDIERDIVTQEAIQVLHDSINELPYKYREVLILRFLEEREYSEIMDILQLPKGTVASLINRGKKILQKNLQVKKLFSK